MAGKKKLTEEQKAALINPIVPAATPTITQEELDAQREANKAAALASVNEEHVAPEEIRPTVLTDNTTPQVVTNVAPASAILPQDALDVKRATTKATIESDPVVQALDAANTQRYNSMYDLVQAYQAEQAAREKELTDEENSYKKAAAWAGAGEIATSLANLIGVASFGASNQVYSNNFSKDWMTKADEARKTRLETHDRMSSRLDELKLKLADAKSEGALTRATYVQKQQQLNIAQQKADAQVAYQNARTELVDAQKAVNDARAAYWNSKTENEKQYYAARVNDLEKKQKNAERNLDLKKQDLDRKNRLADSQVGVNNARKAKIQGDTNYNTDSDGFPTA